MSARELSYAEAIREAMALAMAADPTVVLMGEDIGVYGGAFQVTGDLIERFGPDRVIDTPISELGAAGVAVGAALTGLKPVFEFQFSDFGTLAMEQIVNQAAKIRYMLGGAVSAPLVMRFPAGSGTGAAAQHSQSLEAWFAHVPGLKVVQPSTPHDAKGLLLAAIADPDPVMIFEHKLLYKIKGPMPGGPLHRAARPGRGAPQGRRRDRGRHRDHGPPRAGRRRAAGGGGNLAGGDRPARAAPARRADADRKRVAHRAAAGGL